MAGTVIICEDLHVRLGSGAGEVHVLKGIDLDVTSGELVSLVGPSGSGKSTLLMAVAGLERPHAGRVTVAGTDITRLGEDDLARLRGRAIGIVFQSFHLIPNMTALENVAVPLELAGVDDAFDRAEAELHAIGLDDRLTHYPAELSGGEQQRVAIARALVPGPSILLADEPTGNLDAANGALIADLLFEAQARRGTTLLLVTHDLALAGRSSRIVRLQSGRILGGEPARTPAAARSVAGVLSIRRPRGGTATPLPRRAALAQVRRGPYIQFCNAFAGRSAATGRRRNRRKKAMTENRKRAGRAIAAGIALACATTLLGTTASRAADQQFTFAMITHAQPGDTFWDIIRKGANAAAAKDNVKLVYLADPDANKEAQLIQNVTQQKVDGIALTLAFPDAEAANVKAAQAAGIPIVGFNAGVDQWKDMGLLGYAGQDETVAGKAVGDQLNKEGAKSVVCLDQQQGAVQLEARCNGIKSTFKGDMQVLYVTGYDMPTVKSRVQAKLQQDPNIDYIVTLGAPFAPTVLDAITAAGSKAKVGTFDMTPRVIDMIAQGKVQWAVDQQPYVEGYEAVDMLWLYLTNGDTVGGGGPVLTGPFFVTKDNSATVAMFAKAGKR